MTYPAPFLRLVIQGTLFSVETFSYGLSLLDNFGDTPAPADVPQAVIDAVTAFHTSGPAAHAEARLTTIKLNEIGIDGRYTSQSDTIQYDYVTPLAGTGAASMPAQVAAAISLRTAKQRGRAHVGRFYVPFGGSVSSNGLMSTTSHTDLLADATAFLNALNAAIPGYRVGVASSIGTGDTELVTHVRLGKVLDTIRSRRRSIPEDYVDGPALAPA